MCRIYGHFGGEPVDRDVLRAVARAMHHGGPDDRTVHTADTWALGNNRLAVQGIEHGRQPFVLGDMTCVFNGEIYNHRELRAELVAAGHT
ncbi:asparagine synthase (glutamine-hydrolyzing), partial [Streptomyces sp. NPDC054901]